MKPITLILGGKRWKLKQSARVVVNGKQCDGYCDYKTHTLVVSKGLTQFDELETEVHEMRHATGEFLEEDFVAKESKETAAALWRLGYRKLSAAEIKGLEKLRDG